MSTIKRLSKKDFDDFIRIVVNAYPGFKITTEEQERKLKQRLMRGQYEDPTEHCYGLFRKGKLLGGMLLHDFIMNFFSTRTKVGGVGLVAVDLLHKKEKVCKELIMYFLQHYFKRGVCMTALYPFRPDFYKKMGFGYGAKINQYRTKPAHLPRGKSKRHITFLAKKNAKALLDCYNRYTEKTHGMIERTRFYVRRMLENPGVRIVAYECKNKIFGYIIFHFKPSKDGNFVLNDLHINEFIFEDREVLSELLTFLHTQADQINHIVYNTQDENFHHIPLDPRNGSDNLIAPISHETNIQGLGIMYRVIDTKGVFRTLKEHNFNNQNCRLKLTIRDSFFRKNEGRTIIHFENGIAHPMTRANYDVEIRLDISEFSSLIMGVVSLKSLYDYNLVDISDSRYIETVNRIFMTPVKPLCTTVF